MHAATEVGARGLHVGVGEHELRARKAVSSAV